MSPVNQLLKHVCTETLVQHVVAKCSFSKLYILQLCFSLQNTNQVGSVLTQ